MFYSMVHGARAALGRFLQQSDLLSYSKLLLNVVASF
jgi:hypothetical protein